MTDDTTRTTNPAADAPVEQPEASELETKNTLDQLQDELAQSKAREQRLLADYQNLIRRNREEQSRWAKLATKDFITELLLPLEHLMRAATQVSDKGLDMVVQQLWQTLERHGVQRLQTVGQPFDVRTMEAVEQTGESMTVISEVRPGFTLYGEVIQHAKVIVGDDAHKKDQKKN